MFDNGTNVGIGTTTPDIYGIGTGHFFVSTSTSTSSKYAINTLAGGSSAGGELDFGNQTIRHAAMASLNGSHLVFYTNNSNSGTSVTERLRITSSGFIGIGTTSPGGKLEIDHGSSLGLKLSGTNNHLAFHDGAESNTGSNWWYIYRTGGDGKLRFYRNGDKVTIDASGNFGIGTSTPATLLHVLKNTNGEASIYVDNQNGSSAETSVLYANGSGGGYSHLAHFGSAYTTNGLIAPNLTWLSGSDNVMVGTRVAGKDLIFHTAGFAAANERMRILANGSVGIGTSTATNLLVLKNSNYIAWRNNANTSETVGISSSTADDLQFYNSGTRMTILASGNVGIGTTSPIAKLHLNNGCLLVDGTSGSTPVTGAGTRMMWVPAKAAFRAGIVTSSQWDNTSIGNYSVAFGMNSQASGDYSCAFGASTASGHTSTAFGGGSIASGDYSYALGNSTVSGDYSIAVGNLATASGNFASAFGSSATASGAYTNAFGSNTTASGDYSTAIGMNTTAQAN